MYAQKTGAVLYCFVSSMGRRAVGRGLSYRVVVSVDVPGARRVRVFRLGMLWGQMQRGRVVGESWESWHRQMGNEWCGFWCQCDQFVAEIRI